MRVTLIGAYPPQEKGEAHYLGRYAEALREVGDVDIEVISQHDGKPSRTVLDGLPVYRILSDRSRQRLSYAKQRELVSSVLETRCDVAHIHYGPGPDYGGRLGEPLCWALNQLRAHGVRTVLTLHSVWLPGDVRDEAARLGIPHFARPLLTRYFGRFMRRLRSSVDVELLLVSRESSPLTERFAKAYGIRGLAEEVHGAEVRNAPPSSRGELLILAFGFLRPDKGFDILIESFRQYVTGGGKARLRIIGRPQGSRDALCVEKLLRQARAVPEGRCDLQVRYASDSELDRELAAADVIAVPYLRNVGASGPLHHALGFGKPIICSDAGHNVVFRGELEVVPSGDIVALRDATKRVVEDRDHRNALSAAARRLARARLWATLARRNRAIYRALCDAKPDLSSLAS